MVIVDKPRHAPRELTPEGPDGAPARPGPSAEPDRVRDATWLWMLGPLSDLG
jgi:hypothetical protein